MPMGINSTLFFVIDDFSDLNYLADSSDIFITDNKLSEFLYLTFKAGECSPPDSLVNKILTNNY